MNLEQLAQHRRRYLDQYYPYKCMHWSNFNYRILDNIIYRKRPGRGDNFTCNDVIIMCDTETSKAHPNTTYTDAEGNVKYNPVDNYVVAWTISIRAFERNIVTLYGSRPSDFIKAIVKIIGNMNGYETIFFWHNLSYDWTFIRRFMIDEFGEPVKQLNVKSHYPVSITFGNGIILRDSLILAQRSLEKWAIDMDVEHKKSVGKWDYDKIRIQDDGTSFSDDELEYIEHDTLAGVECIDKLRIMLNKTVMTLPYTATGIVREEVRNAGREHHQRDKFKKMCMTYDHYCIAEHVFHGGYTHANRHFIDKIFNNVKCYDFASSYPFVMLTEKFPMERFSDISDADKDYILQMADVYAFMFKLVLIKPRLKDDFYPMPALQFSKCVHTINSVCDNGRILCAEYAEIYITEIDLKIITEQYDADKWICTTVKAARKDYLPRWFTDIIFNLFGDKTMLKKSDKVLYNLQKAKLNSEYGMTVQKSIKDEIVENYDTGEYKSSGKDRQELYEKYLKNRNSILPYQWGIYVTAYAFYNLFQLGKCCTDPDHDLDSDSIWIYSDTDSVYGTGWNDSMVDAYNQRARQKLLDNGYGPVVFDGREYWIGAAELDGEYSEFKTLGAKRYCCRSKSDGQLHITVAGVPKSGVKVLNDDINKFTKSTKFRGEVTGKLTHSYIMHDAVWYDSCGNECADSVDLTPCDYLLDKVDAVDWEAIFKEEIEIQVYEE